MVKKEDGMHHKSGGKESGKRHAEHKKEVLSGQHTEEIEETGNPKGSEKDADSPNEGAQTGNQDPGNAAEAEIKEDPTETGLMEMEEVIAGLQEKLKASDDKYLRLVAEFDNYRKRTLKEKAELTKLAGEEILTGLLPVIDDFDRAIGSMSNSNDNEALKKGIELIHGKFTEFLNRKGVREIKAIGSEFDTDLHEAVTKIPVTSKKEKGRIVDVILKGYTLYDKVIRYAKVVVGE